jgi:hypothetical protein
MMICSPGFTSGPLWVLALQAELLDTGDRKGARKGAVPPDPSAAMSGRPKSRHPVKAIPNNLLIMPSSF